MILRELFFSADMKKGKMKIGLFGGSFDPIHNGHLQIADWTKNQLALNKIIFIPAANPPHKLHSIIASVEQRFKMTQLAILNHSNFEISDVEILRKGVSYTIDTVLFFRERYNLQRDDLFLLIGGDSLIDLALWRSPEKIIENCRVVVFQRPGADLAAVPCHFTNTVQILETPLIDISSTAIRKKIASGDSIAGLMPDSVVEFIQMYNLYKKQ